jgi:hypothetical protein
MVALIECAEEGDKDRLVKLSSNFLEDAGDFVGMLHDAAGVTEEDLARHEADDEELAKDAASADQIRTAKVKE